MSGLVFSPLLPGLAIAVLAVIALLGLALALWRGLAGWGWRSLAALVIILALSGPNWRAEERVPLNDIVILIEDQSASNSLAGRSERTGRAAQQIAEAIAARGDTDLHRVRVPDGPDNAGTLLMSALSEALAELPRTRIAGIILLSDGRLHDLPRAPDLPAPMHLIHTGKASDWDRRVIVENAPAFGILGEKITLRLQVRDEGPAAPEGAGNVPIDIAVDGGAAERYEIPLNTPVDLPLVLPHGGRNVLQFTTPAGAGELTSRNNTALVQINGLRDRLRVLLVSGAPHPGARTWRNLLKSDASVDLVHFTILRPPEKHDGVPVQELSLIAFPTRELFLEKVADFDLIIFDRYKRRGILPDAYLDNVRRYVEEGGAVLVAAGEDFAGASSLYRSPLGRILPAHPTSVMIGEAFRPKVSDLGKRHPVTAGLEAFHDGPWGRWLHQVELEADAGQVVMTGAGERPLLVLDRVGEGRVALLGSDHAWLWHRGYEGGGPQLELLRRLAHWMMKEPELEEEALTATAEGQTMRITRRTLAEDVPPVVITAPDGTQVERTLEQVRPGRFETRYEGPEIGLYRLENGVQKTVIGLGPASPVEFERTIADETALAPAIEAVNGGILALEDGLPHLRDVRAGRPAAGRGWIGLTPRDAHATLSVTQRALLPAWAVLLLAAGLILAGWLREGRQ